MTKNPLDDKKVYCDNDSVYRDDQLFLFKRNVSTNQMIRIGKYKRFSKDVINAKTFFLGYPNPPLINSNKAVNMYDSGFYIKDGNYDGVMDLDQYCDFYEGFYTVEPMPYDLENFTQISAKDPEHPHYTIGFTKPLDGVNKTIVTLWDYYVADRQEAKYTDNY